MINLFNEGLSVQRRRPQPSATMPALSKPTTAGLSADPQNPQGVEEAFLLSSPLDLIDFGLPLIVGPKDDTGFIERRLLLKTRKESDWILREYIERWRAGTRSEPFEHRKHNAGRFDANTWLRNLDEMVKSQLVEITPKLKFEERT